MLEGFEERFPDLPAVGRFGDHDISDFQDCGAIRLCIATATPGGHAIRLALEAQAQTGRLKKVL